MDETKIAIIGQGFVGKAFKSLVENYYPIITYDPKFDQSYPQKEIDECTMGVICVPTPEKTDGSCDVSFVEDAVSRLNTKLILIKSTVEPGTVDRLIKKTKKRIIFSPEFVGESRYYQPYWHEMIEEPFVIFGGVEKDTDEVIAILERIMGPTKQYYKCSAVEAEVIKYMENSFFATKVTFVNEFFDICQHLGANWYKVREGWLLDPRINRMHTSVFKNDRGFGGKCYPKDLSAIIAKSKNAGYRPELLEQVVKSNLKFRSQRKVK